MTEGVSGGLAAVIVLGILAQWIAAAPLASHLGLSAPSRRGMLIVGARSWARGTAAVLRNEGFQVRLVDTNREHINEARMAGLDSVYGNALAALLVSTEERPLAPRPGQTLVSLFTSPLGTPS